MTTRLCPVSFAELRVGWSQALVWCPRCATHHDAAFLHPRDEIPCSTCGHRLSGHGRYHGHFYACSLSTCGCTATDPKENTVTDLSYDYETLARELARDMIFDHARDVEHLSITEKLADMDTDDEIPIPDFDAIAEHVGDLIAKATVTVELPASGNPLVAAKETTG